MVPKPFFIHEAVPCGHHAAAVKAAASEAAAGVRVVGVGAGAAVAAVGTCGGIIVLPNSMASTRQDSSTFGCCFFGAMHFSQPRRAQRKDKV